MRQSKLDTPLVKKQTVQRLALGESQGSIARDVGLDPSQVSRFSRREDIKAAIEKETFRLLESLPDAVSNMKSLVEGMKSLPKEDKTGRDLAFKASTKILESAGMLSTQAPSHTVVNIVNQTTNILSPAVKQLLQAKIQECLDIPDPD